MIELKNIDVTFQNGSHEFKAVDNVSLKINKGEIFGIVGPSGAGKSTLVRVINLLQRPTNGEVIIEGSDITKFNRKQLRKTRLNIGMIFQHFNLISGSTIAENVAFSLYANNYPKDKIKDRVKELLEIVHLPEKADAYPANLSGGQKQRVAIARALANNPDILLCDEATSALDIENTEGVTGSVITVSWICSVIRSSQLPFMPVNRMRSPCFRSPPPWISESIPAATAETCIFCPMPTV